MRRRLLPPQAHWHAVQAAQTLRRLVADVAAEAERLLADETAATS